MIIVVSGQVANAVNQGGAAWVVLQYLLGLRGLGHDVYFLESTSSADILPEGSDLHHSLNGAYFAHIMREFGLSDRASLIDISTRDSIGLSYEHARRIGGSADLLLNLSGHLRAPALLDAFSVRVYVDLDPGFTQLWHAYEGIDMGLEAHTHFVTIGESVGRSDCGIPDCDRTWLTTRQPIFLEEWPVAASIEHDAFTTVANWRGYGSIDFNGLFFGQKAHSMRRLFDLPCLSGETFELALGIHPDETQDLEALRCNGWWLLDPLEVAATPEQFRRFVQGSRAEFGIAKSGYVAGKTGWFSDRSVCYLASGRPVVAQETGFSRHLPTGEGLHAFETADDALQAFQEIKTGYARNVEAARTIAETYFDSRKVLSSLLENLQTPEPKGGQDAD